MQSIDVVIKCSTSKLKDSNQIETENRHSLKVAFVFRVYMGKFLRVLEFFCLPYHTDW